ALRDSLEIARSLGVKIDAVRATGGGARSPLWRKLIADIMNVKVEIMNSEEGPGYGGAILAAVGCGEYASVSEATKKIVKVKDELLPDAEAVKAYEEKYKVWKQLYPALKGVYRDVAHK
ncbi:MAG: xylulokinase, partial [Lachnospiraceae bacterium]|nr:xylulokinase [Lachnospiraceae bacterium]